MRRAGERGQTFILFSLLLTLLLGGLAIVIDVGNLYLTRRQLQNVADEAALVGAQKRSDNSLCLSPVDAIKEARAYATKNGVYTDSGVANHIWHPDPDGKNGVVVNYPPSTGNHSVDHPASPDHPVDLACGYLEVRVARTVNSFFAGFLGANPVRIEARAVARGFGGYAEAALIALKDDPQAIKIGGSSYNQIVGSVYSRGNVFANSGTLDTDPGDYVYARGTVDLAGLSADAATRVVQNAPDISDPNWPKPTASTTVRTISDVDPLTGWKTALPGTYDVIGVGPGDKVMFQPGVYRVTKSLKIQGVAAGRSDLPITSLDPKVQPPYSDANPPVGEAVCFVLDDTVTFEITADGTAHFQSSAAYNNLIIRSVEDKNAVTIDGQGNISLWGTIYAPAGDIALAGGSGGTVHGQVVGGTISLLGTAGPVVIYDPGRVPATRRTVLVE